MPYQSFQKLDNVTQLSIIFDKYAYSHYKFIQAVDSQRADLKI
jgi:hypothetical protein